jgi:hypothetical protein
MNEPRVGIPPDLELRMVELEGRIAALESEMTHLQTVAGLPTGTTPSQERTVIRVNSLARALEAAAELFPSPTKPVLERLMDPDAGESLLTCTVEWAGDPEDSLKRTLDWHERIEGLPGLKPLELGICVLHPHGTN